MSKGKVNDYFSARKRNRFNQDDVLLNKKNKTQTVIDIPAVNVLNIDSAQLIKAVETELRSRSTRSNTKQASSEVAPAPVEINQNEPEKKPTRASARKQKMEELKQKMNRFDDKLSKVKEIVSPKPVEVESKTPEPVQQKVPAKPKCKKKVNMAELKAKIQSFNDNLQAVQEKVETSKKEMEAREAKAAEQAPELISAAFNKFKDLASSDIDIKCTLTLPTSYARILNTFKGCDSILKFLKNRQETCTFLKLKLGVQNITKHTLTLKQLGQIKTAYPLAYYYKQEKMFIDFKNDYHLTIHPNLDEVEGVNEKGIKEFSPGLLLTRLNRFKSCLFTIVKNLHQKFLESIGINNVDFKDIKRWHPKFDLEGVESIIESELPKSPNESIKVKTGKDLLNIAKDVYSSRIQEAIKDHAKETNDKKLGNLEIVGEPVLIGKLSEKEGTPKSLPTKKTTISKENSTPSVKKTVDEQKMEQLKEKKEKNFSSLLEKIRTKEKTKAYESMVINSDKEKKLVKYANYKEAIRFLLFFFQAEKKSTLELEKIIPKLSDKLKDKLSETECRELLTELMSDSDLYSESGSKWITVIKVRNLNYLKMDKSFQLNDLWAKCDKLISALY